MRRAVDPPDRDRIPDPRACLLRQRPEGSGVCPAAGGVAGSTAPGESGAAWFAFRTELSDLELPARSFGPVERDGRSRESRILPRLLLTVPEGGLSIPFD